MSAVATPAEGPSGRICLVDDHAEFRQSAAWWLESLGYEVECWEEPVAFLEAMTERPAEPACFLLDVRMPGMSGLELMEAARERGLDQPVIFMTGHGDVPLAVEAMRRGAWAVVVGTAITHPTSITGWFAKAVDEAN